MKKALIIALSCLLVVLVGCSSESADVVQDNFQQEDIATEAQNPDSNELIKPQVKNIDTNKKDAPLAPNSALLNIPNSNDYELYVNALNSNDLDACKKLRLLELREKCTKSITSNVNE